ncbi:hypothetical protein GCM10025876_04230 [Demequina litorisediminis]|uniref:Elongation factor EFG domain-containing protein n=1 Tax=Demequina litorisediminis TaxID=1849022 RepID=A0ABQ6I9C0_9MICO|nr:hypothetical protein GCM10025876_04230 [Demequina litorisediminis]
MGTMNYLSETRVEMHYTLPLAEVVFDFFDQLKSRTRGYGSLDYEPAGDQVADLVKVDILLQGETVDAFSAVVHKDAAYSYGVSMVTKPEGPHRSSAVRGAHSGRHRVAHHRPRDHPRHPQGRAREVLRRRHLP